MKKISYIVIIVILVIVAYYSFQSAKAELYGSSLVGWWRMDTNDDLNGVTRDRSGSNNNGNLVNIATSTFYSTGKIGQGFNFDGVNQAVNVPDSASLSITGNITVSVWVNPRTMTGDHALIDKRSSGNNSYQLTWKAVGAGWNAYFVIDTGTAGVAEGTSEFPFNQWAHIVGVWDGSTVFLYINGVLEDITPQTGSMSNTTEALRMGLNHTDTEDFDGRLDEVRVYNRALSAGEVAQLYNQGLKINAFGDF